MKRFKHPYLFAFLAGLMMVLGFSPFNIWPIGFLIPALLFLLQEKTLKTHATSLVAAHPSKAFLIGLAFGCGIFGAGTSWIYVSLSRYGGGPFLALLCTLAFVLILALFPALQFYLMARCFSRYTRTLKLLVIYPSLWLLFEFLRSTIFTGFPWLLLGYTQTFTLLAGFAKIGSVFLISWLSVFVGGLLLLIFSPPKQVKNHLKIIYCCGLLGLFTGGYILRQHQFTRPLGKPLQVALVQGNIPDTAKWSTSSLQQIMRTYANLTTPVLNTALIVWPENSIPEFPQNIMRFIAALDQDTHLFKSALVFGLPIENPVNQHYFNGALALGDANGMYLKQHLVPFGEYLPFANWLQHFYDYFNIPMSSFSAGPANHIPMQIHGLPVSVFICYESAYPLLFRQASQAAYIITLTDDGWFGHSLGIYQHEEMEAMRAIETGRPILRATNTGITSIIDQNGHIIARAPAFQEYVLQGKIQPITGKTPWLRI